MDDFRPDPLTPIIWWLCYPPLVSGSFEGINEGFQTAEKNLVCKPQLINLETSLMEISHFCNVFKLSQWIVLVHVLAKIENQSFFFANAEVYRVVWTINVLLTVRSEMLPFSGNNQHIKIVTVPPEHCAIGYVHNDNLPLSNLHCNMSFKTTAGRSDGVFCWFPALSEDQEKIGRILQILSCGFNGCFFC